MTRIAAITNGLTGDSYEVRATPYGGNFIHPGVMHTFADLERMRTNVLAANQPWYQGYTNLLAGFAFVHGLSDGRAGDDNLPRRHHGHAANGAMF